MDLWNGLQPLESRPGDAIPSPQTVKRLRTVQERASQAPAGRKFNAVPNPWSLTGTEWACLAILTDTGLPHKAAANQLFMSHKTMATHLMRSKEKMEAQSTIHMVLMFDRWRRGNKPTDFELVVRYVGGSPSVQMREVSPE